MTVVKDLDIWGKSGAKLLPHDEFIKIRTQRGEVFINEKKVKDAISSDGRLHVKFEKGAQDNPKVNAILLVRGGLKNTHQKNFD